MTREGGSAVRSNIQPPEILRCLFNELTANGLIMKSIEPKLAMLQLHENNQVNAENKEMIDAPEASTSNFFSQISAILEEISLKPIGRIASGITTECISGWHDSLDNFDNSWKEISSENVDRQIKIMQSLTGLRSEQIPESAGKSIFPVEEMPASDLIVNPFASIQKDDNPWEYLTELTNPNPTTIKALRTSCDIGGLSVDDPLADSTISAIRESKVHPFIHPESMFFGKVISFFFFPFLIEILGECWRMLE